MKKLSPKQVLDKRSIMSEHQHKKRNGHIYEEIAKLEDGEGLIIHEDEWNGSKKIMRVTLLSHLHRRIREGKEYYSIFDGRRYSIKQTINPGEYIIIRIK